MGQARLNTCTTGHVDDEGRPIVDHIVQMPTAYSLPSKLSRETVTNTASLIRIVALCFISGAAIASRLFAVVNFESIIHEL